MLFPSAGLVRTLALEEGKMSANDEARATHLFGSEQWRAIYDARAQDKISAADAREEYVNLMRWRLERELGYRFTHAFELKNTNGVPVYHMIFATDNDVGNEDHGGDLRQNSGPDSRNAEGSKRPQERPGDDRLRYFARRARRHV